MPLGDALRRRDATGVRLEFDPGAPSARPTYRLGADEDLLDLACPSVRQCTAISSGGQVQWFDPASESAASNIFQIDEDGNLLGIACPSLRQCTAVDDLGGELTFDPRTLVGPIPAVPRIALDPDSLTALACPSATRCTAVDDHGREVTFAP